MKAARRASACRAAATCSPASSAASWPAAPSRCSALLWAVWLHGEAGAKLAKKVGPIGFLAREIADEVPGLLPR